MESEAITDPLFKKAQALKKVVMQYSNKTYVSRNELTENKYIFSIKVEICRIFNFILDLKQDFLIENVMAYFK